MTAVPHLPLRGTAARCALARRGDLGEDVLVWLVDVGDAALRDAVASSRHLSPAVVDALMACGDADVRYKLAWREVLPDDEARRIVEESDAAEAQALADERHASGDVGVALETSDPSVLRELAGHPDAAVREAVARNDETPGDVVAALLWEPDRPPFRALPDEEPDEAAAGIRRAAARHDNLPPAEFDAAARHPDRDVRGIIAQRLDIGVELLIEFARDPSPFIRSLALHHGALPVTVLRELADDPEEPIREAVLRHRSCPFDLLERLAERTTDNLAYTTPVREATPAQLEALARSRSARLRAAVADNPRLAPETPAGLVADRHRHVMLRVAANPGLTEAQIRSLYSRRNARVWTRLAQLPQCPPDVLADLAERAVSMPRVVRAVAAHDSTPAEAVARLARHADAVVRRTVAGRGDITGELAMTLLGDPHGEVAAAAAGNPVLPEAAMRSMLQYPGR